MRTTPDFLLSAYLSRSKIISLLPTPTPRHLSAALSSNDGSLDVSSLPRHSGCEECNNTNPSVCQKHGPLHPIPNRPVVSKARASLPLVLYIDRLLGGVFSKRRIPKRTQFGPVEGPLVPQNELQDHYIQLKASPFSGLEKKKQTPSKRGGAT